jgi:hypothetical protein
MLDHTCALAAIEADSAYPTLKSATNAFLADQSCPHMDGLESDKALD